MSSASAASTAVAMVSRRVHGTVTGAPGAGRFGRFGAGADPGSLLGLVAGVSAAVLTGKDISCRRVSFVAMVATPRTDETLLPARGVVIAATPLGNAADVSERLRAALAGADVIAAEDTRRARALAASLGVEPRGKIVSNFDHNEDQRARDLLAAAREGVVLVVTDAGMPIVSDPGHSLVAAAHDAGVPVTCFPGPSAVTTALALSGLSVGHFIFDGFAPRKPGAREAWLTSLVGERRAVCFFESPHRIGATLADAARVLGPDRRAAVCRELTKTYEEVRRGTLAELAKWAAEGLRGEVTVVIEGGEPEAAEPEDLVGEVLARVDAGERMKDAVKAVAKQRGVKNGELYDAALAAREG